MSCTTAEMEALEGMVDRHGLTQVLVAIVEICGEKADHLRSNWQDEGSAKIWEKDAKLVEKAAVRVNN